MENTKKGIGAYVDIALKSDIKSLMVTLIFKLHTDILFLRFFLIKIQFGVAIKDDPKIDKYNQLLNYPIDACKLAGAHSKNFLVKIVLEQIGGVNLVCPIKSVSLE